MPLLASGLTELACLDGITQPAMTQHVSRPEKDSLAERIKDPADGLTAEGVPAA